MAMAMAVPGMPQAGGYITPDAATTTTGVQAHVPNAAGGEGANSGEGEGEGEEEEDEEEEEEERDGFLNRSNDH